ncbi:Phosphoglycerate kinase [Cucumispora dikerogammari]|nr:Phosphoglycerate kinase [Cucumispora dikerogammari]
MDQQPKPTTTARHLTESRILIHVDFNIPISPLDISKIEQVLPTIYSIINDVYSITIISHFGRPGPPLFNSKGKMLNQEFNSKSTSQLQKNNILKERNKIIQKYTLKPLYEILKTKFKIFQNLQFNTFENRGKDFLLTNYSKNTVTPTKNIELIENIRFYEIQPDVFIDPFKNKVTITRNKDRKKTKNIDRYDRKKFYDLYIFDAFASIHRFIPEINILPQIYGSSIIKGIDFCKKIINTKFDLLFIGGAKYEKLNCIQHLMTKNTICFLMGKLAFGIQTKTNSYYNIEMKPNIILPEDYRLANGDVIDAKKLDKGTIQKIRDIGPKTIATIATRSFKNLKILFNGTPGVFELIEHSKGTISLLSVLNEMKKQGSEVYIIGADTNSAVDYFSASGIDLDQLKESQFRNTAGGAILSIINENEQAKKNLKSLDIEIKKEVDMDSDGDSVNIQG